MDKKFRHDTNIFISEQRITISKVSRGKPLRKRNLMDIYVCKSEYFPLQQNIHRSRINQCLNSLLE